MNAWIGWALAAAALAAGTLGYGWRGLALALSVIVFWLLLQFSRSLRVLRLAAQAPVGHVASAVMFNARLRPGMRLADVIKLAGSLGRRVSNASEAWAWEDAGGAEVTVEFDGARCVRWALQRPDEEASASASGHNAGK